MNNINLDVPLEKHSKTIILSKRSRDENSSDSEYSFNNQNSLLRKNNNLNKAVKKAVGRWSIEERKQFLHAVEIYGDNW